MEKLRKAVYDRRRGIGILAAVATGSYFICSYLSSKLSEIQDQADRDRVAKQSLRRKFYQILQDSTFTVMALLPPLESQLDGIFNVHAITEELKERAKSPSMSHSAVFSESSLAPSSDDNGMHSSAISNDSSAISLGGHSEQSAQSEHSNSLPSSDASPSSPLASKISQLKLKSKKDLWEELKVRTVAQTITIHYAVTLLTLLTHIQLSHLGREAYIAQLRALARSRAPVPFEAADYSNSDSDTSDKTYLSLSWWFIYSGLPRLSERIKGVVDDVIGGASLRDTIGGSRLIQWIKQIRAKLDCGPVEEFLDELFPMTDKTLMETLDGNQHSNNVHTGEMFVDLVEQTRTSLLTSDLKSIMTDCLNKSFDQLAASLSHLPSNKLASQLPKVKKSGQTSLHSVPNEMVEMLANHDDLLAFDALIQTNYESAIDKVK
ncbi:hypothetical protein E3P81_01113 [Wallemia ichthyophaga]|nr:hypothetical protein E3P82_01112 [Wallemia ichthyophaga]TIB52737.1 hypothetical protein E3P81_01113 [Wallemia ichthyophaga]TIB55463.1 hypothetical protein E3P80_01113 [Wallemia ichthyophaga]